MICFVLSCFASALLCVLSVLCSVPVSDLSSVLCVVFADMIAVS